MAVLDQNPLSHPTEHSNVDINQATGYNKCLNTFEGESTIAVLTAEDLAARKSLGHEKMENSGKYLELGSNDQLRSAMTNDDECPLDWWGHFETRLVKERREEAFARATVAHEKNSSSRSGPGLPPTRSGDVRRASKRKKKSTKQAHKHVELDFRDVIRIIKYGDRRSDECERRYSPRRIFLELFLLHRMLSMSPPLHDPPLIGLLRARGNRTRPLGGEEFLPLFLESSGPEKCSKVPRTCGNVGKPETNITVQEGNRGILHSNTSLAARRVKSER